ncbi:MAG: hypothetical protein E6Q40_08835 [Cupriavidus sp.]|nr:MAG: hypothetical protein E6Q40_08835 [Cupriavidus sp.]
MTEPVAVPAPHLSANRPRSSTVAKTGLGASLIAILVTLWPFVSNFMTVAGVPAAKIKEIDTVVKAVEDNAERIQQLEDFVNSLRTKTVVTPVTPTPVVSPEVQSLQEQVKRLTELINQQNQPPAPIPVVTPPTPTTPPLPSAIKAVDSQGKPVSGSVDPGQQFFVQATATGGTWTIIKSAEPDVDAKVYSDEVSCVLRNGASITIVHSSGQPITTSSLIIKCNKSPQPPPGPTPGPTPVVTVDPVKPTPAPSPGGDLRVMIVFESAQNHTREQLNVLNSTKLLAAMNAKCVMDGGLPSWRRWDKDLDASKDPSPAMRSLWEKVLPIAKSDGLPAMAVACGADVAVYPLPKTEAEAIALLACGGK